MFAGKVNVPSHKQGNGKLDGRRSKKPKMLTKLLDMAGKLMGGGVSKKHARGVKRQLSQKRDDVNRTNSVTGDDCGRSESDERNTDTMADDNAKHKPARDGIVKQRRKLKAVKLDTSSEDSVKTGRERDLYDPPSPARSCDSFSSNEPLMSLQRNSSELKPNHLATDKQVLPKELPVTSIKDEADKKECVPLKSTVASPAMGVAVGVTGLNRTGITGVSADENSSRQDHSSDIETAMVCVKDNHVSDDKSISTMSLAGVKGNTPKILNGVAPVSVQAQVSSAVTQASLPQQERNESETIAGEKPKRRHYKRRSALELLNDVDGPPSRVSRLHEQKMSRRSKEQVDIVPKMAQAADSLPSVADSVPSIATTDSLPSVAAADSVPSAAAADSLPSVAATDSLPSVAATDSVPSVADSVPSIATTDSLPSVATTDSVPSAAAADSLPSVAATDSLPSIAATDSVPSVAAADSVPSIAATDSLPIDADAACVTDRTTTPKKTDQDNECKNIPDVEVKLPEKFAEDQGKKDDKISTAPSVVATENCTTVVKKPSVEGSGKGLDVKHADQKVGEMEKGPRAKKHKGVKRKYKGIKQTNNELTSTEPPQGKKMLADNQTSTEDTANVDKPRGRPALLPKSYSVKRMTTRGKKNRYWWLFSKQTKKVREAARDVETECMSRSGKEKDLLAQCRPCRVMLVDFFGCRKIGRMMALAAEGGDSLDTGSCKPTGLETTEPATKVAKVDVCEKLLGECLSVAARHDGSSVSDLTPTSSSAVRTDASSAATSSSDDVDRMSAARIPRTVPSAEPQPLCSRHRRFKCNHCSFKTTVRSVMDQHVNTHSNIQPYLCGHCHKAFDTRDNVVTHTKQDHHGQLYSIVRRRELADGADYTTQYVRREQPVATVPVSEESPQPDDDKAHVRPRIPILDAVNPRQPYYQCKRCTYATSSVVTIQHHVLDVHSCDRRLICPLCDRAYCKTVTGMTKHYKRWHGDSVVQLRYEPDYYEVWDIKQAEANGVDTACSVRLPCPDSAQFDGQPLIGQPLIVQPGQTFLSQNGMSSERPHPLTLQPSVRYSAKGRAETATDKKVTLAVLSPEELLNKPAIVRHELLAPYHDDGRVNPLSSVPVSCSTDAPVAHQNTSSTMPLLLAVDSYTVPPPRQLTASKADEPIALTMDSPSSLRDVNRRSIFRENVRNGTDSSSASSLRTATCLTKDPVPQMDMNNRSSPADIDDVPELIKGNYGSAGALDTMPLLEKVSFLAFMWCRCFLCDASI